MDPDPSSYTLLDFNLFVGFAGIFILLICSAYISGTEVAIFSLTPKDLDTLNEESPKKGKIITSLLERTKKTAGYHSNYKQFS